LFPCFARLGEEEDIWRCSKWHCFCFFFFFFFTWIVDETTPFSQNAPFHLNKEIYFLIFPS
jgi:hypothetical protein